MKGWKLVVDESRLDLVKSAFNSFWHEISRKRRRVYEKVGAPNEKMIITKP